MSCIAGLAQRLEEIVKRTDVVKAIADGGATKDDSPRKYDNVVHPAFTVPKSLAIDADGKLIC